MQRIVIENIIPKILPERITHFEKCQSGVPAGP
jgi:hypothetical protein